MPELPPPSPPPRTVSPSPAESEQSREEAPGDFCVYYVRDLGGPDGFHPPCFRRPSSSERGGQPTLSSLAWQASVTVEEADRKVRRRHSDAGVVEKRSAAKGA